MDIRLENVLEYEQPTKYIVKSENYSDDFALPVLTAGKSFVLGFTDETDGICKASESPVIIFDDFTADCKYVDFDFKVKSSAMKILHKANTEDNLKYYFYAMQAIDYTPFSHKRVWISEYSKFKIKNRSIAEQNNIVKELDTVATAIDNAKQRLNALDELVKSRFIEMFGHPDANEKGWEKSKLENFINVVGGYAFKSQKYLSKGIPVLRIGNINAGYFRDTNLVFYQEDSALEKYKIYPNDLVISLTGTAGKDDYGNICLMDSTYGVYYLNQRNAKIEIKHNFNRFFLMYLFAHPEIKQRLTGKNHGIRQGNKLNKDILELDVYVPPIELQNEFADFVKLIDKSKFIVQKQIDDVQELLDSKMDEYFG